MANKIIVLDADKERHLRLGINGLIELESVLGRPIAELSEGIGLTEIRTILYIALKWEDKKLTEDKTGEVMDAYIEKHGFEGLGQMVGDLVSSAMGALPSQG